MGLQLLKLIHEIEKRHTTDLFVAAFEMLNRYVTRQ